MEFKEPKEFNSFNSLLQHFSWISDFSCYGSGGGNQRRGEDGA